MGTLRRIGQHLFRAWGAAERLFPSATLDRIGQRIAQSEAGHTGEIVLAVETRLTPAQVWRGITSRQRALDAFNELEVWDTQDDSGVLIYVLLADHAIEIVADRGIAARVSEAQWRAICDVASQRFARGEFEAGVLAAVEGVDILLCARFPATGDARDPDELDNAPVLR